MDLLGDEEDANKKETSKELAKRSSVLDRFPEAFISAVRDVQTRSSPYGRKRSSIMKEFAFTGVGLSVLSEVQFKSYPRSDFDFQSSAAQMRLTEIQKAQMRRFREKVMRELKQVLERIRLSLEEYYMTEKERIVESPDEELLEEERKRRRRERRRRKREEKKREKQKIASQEQEIKSTTAEAPDTKLEDLIPGDSKQQTTETNKNNEQWEIDGEWSESSEEDSESSDEDDDDDDSNESDDDDDDYGPNIRDKVSNTLIIRRVKRQKILKLIDCYLNLCNEREDIIRQMQFWMEATMDEKLESSGPAPPFSPSLLADELTVDIATEVDAFGCNLKRLKDISDSLGIGDSGPDETQDDGKGKKLQPGRGKVATIFNEEELCIAENWLQATTGIEKCFEEAIKSTPVRRIRLSLGNAAKQFKPICRTVERKIEEIQQLDEKVNGLEGEVKKMKKTNEDLRKRSKKAQVKAEKLEHQNRDLQNQLREQKNNVEELKGKLEEIQKESRSLQRGSSESMASLRGSIDNISVVSLVDTPSQQLAPTGEKVTIKTPRTSRVQVSLSSDKSIDSEESIKEIQELKSSLEITEEELKIEKEKSVNLQEEFVSLQSEKVKVEQERSDLEIQLEDARRENERALEELSQKLEDEERKNKKMALEIECNEEMIKYQEERLHQFMEEIQAMEERIMSLPSTPATMSIASMAGPARRERRKTSLQLGLEPQTARQMVAKVKQQYEEEIQSLKEHMAKETQRHQAEMRRTDQDHKKDVQNIHKESMLLLRALNRFKDCVASLLEREHLSQEAHAIRSLAPLPLDEKFGDTRQMLARMAILSNELLTSLELHLSRGLMSKRLEIKDTTFGKTLTQVELENQGDALRKSKDLGALQVGKLKTKREELLDQRNEYAIKMLLERGKQQDVVERFKELQTLNTVLDKEMKVAKKASDEAMHKKEHQLKKILQREIDARRIVEQQKIIIKSLASIWRSRRIGQKFIRREDQLKNLQLLEEAMAENEIPQALYENTTRLIREAMLFPRKRFIELVKKYIHFRRVKEIQENVAKVRMESSVNESVLLAMREAEERMLRQKEIWRQKKELFCKARSEALEKLCEIISRVQEETGILLTKPIELIPRLEDIKEDIKEIDDEAIREAVNIPKERSKLRRAQAQLEARLAAGADLPPSSLDGMAMPSDRNQGPVWKAIGSLPAAVVTTPRLLDLDINRSRFAAQSALSRLNKGPWDTETVSLPPLSFFPSCGMKLTHRLRETRSEPLHRKKTAKTVRSVALPSIASLFPEEAERDVP